MFTGIIESLAEVLALERRADNLILRMQCELASGFRIDESVAHNGVCLTVEDVDAATLSYQLTAIRETLDRSMLGELAVGDRLNVERSLPVNARLDGHFVQGHVDAVGTVIERRDRDGSWQIWISYPQDYIPLVVEKGSIAVNGVSLTIAHLDDARPALAVEIIPHTWQKTNAARWREGSRVNLEFDILGKYARRLIDMQRSRGAG